MKHRFLCTLLALVLLGSSLTSMAFAAPESTPPEEPAAGSSSEEAIPAKTEISFQVGDEILLINGKKVTTEKPYVAGEGTTLVPLRVITEAFGAVVNWEQETKTITLVYEDITVILQIGSKTASVGDHMEQLTEAPVLSQSGVTMVPLRFLSETFGATVGYDHATQRVTVVKEPLSNTSTITGVTELAKIGDSYYGWSMDTPKTMQMEKRSLDGRATSFSEDKNSMIITIGEIKDISLEENFENIKSAMKDYTLIKSDKTKDRFHLRAKSDTGISDAQVFYHGNYIFAVSTVIHNETTQEKSDHLLALANSFQPGYQASADIYDLSNVNEEGYRPFHSEKYGISFLVPKDFIDISRIGEEQQFTFAKLTEEKYLSIIAADVCSKSDQLSAQSLAQKDRDTEVSIANPDFRTVSELLPIDTDIFSGYYYTVTTSGSEKDEGIKKDIYFEKGSYIYNISITEVPGQTDFINIIEKSIQIKPVDENKVGTILRNDPDEALRLPVQAYGCAFQIPDTWEILSQETGHCRHKLTDSLFYLAVGEFSDSISANQFKEAVKEMAAKPKDETLIPVGELTTLRLDGSVYYKFCFKQIKNEQTNYITIYTRQRQNKIYLFTLEQRDIYFNSPLDLQIQEILKTLVIK